MSARLSRGLGFLVVSLSVGGLLWWAGGRFAENHISFTSRYPTGFRRPSLAPPQTPPDLRKLLDPAQAIKSSRSARPRLSREERDRLAAEIRTGVRRLRTRLDQGDVGYLRGGAHNCGTRGVTPPHQEVIDELQALLGGHVKLHVDSVTGVLRYLRGDLAPLVDGVEDFTRADAEGDVQGKALAVAERLGRVMRIRSPREEFVVARSATDALGMVHVQLQQVYAGVPVWGAQVNVHFGPDGMPLEVSGLYTSTPVKMPMPAFEITEDEALRHAESAVGVATPPGRSTVQVRRMVYWDRDRAPVL